MICDRIVTKDHTCVAGKHDDDDSVDAGDAKLCMGYGADERDVTAVVANSGAGVVEEGFAI